MTPCAEYTLYNTWHGLWRHMYASHSTWRGLRLGMPDVEAPVATIAAIEDEVIVMNALVRLLLHVRFVLGRPVELAAEIRHTFDVDEFIVDALFVSDVCIRKNTIKLFISTCMIFRRHFHTYVTCVSHVRVHCTHIMCSKTSIDLWTQKYMRTYQLCRFRPDSLTSWCCSFRWGRRAGSSCSRQPASTECSFV